MLTVLEVWDAASSCHEHVLGVPRELAEQAETVVAMGGCSCTPFSEGGANCGSWCDSGSFAIGALPDGRHLAVWESSDSTGHG